MPPQASSAAAIGFVPYGNGYEYTESRPIITKKLAMVRDERLPIIVVHEGYQSGPCILIDFSDTRLQIDKPRDWPGRSQTIRVIFRDQRNLWNHFYCKVVSTSKDTLFTTFPTQFFILQRRQHYRVEAPTGSKVSFTYKDRVYDDFLVKDISAGGLLMCHRTPIEFPPQAEIGELMITLPMEDSADPITLFCRKARIVRSDPKPRAKLYCFGVEFQPNAKEEDALIRYVRQRELKILRKSAAS